jgi:hypothetical protein
MITPYRWEVTVPRLREHEEYAYRGTKDYWHLYSLQALTPTRFTKVVTMILHGRYLLLNTKGPQRGATV